MNTKDYEKIVDFINQHNDQICHITTWQTWKKESKLVLLVMIELLDNDLLTDMNNKENNVGFEKLCKYLLAFSKIEFTLVSRIDY